MTTPPTQEQYRAYAAELSSFKQSECACKTCRGLCSMVPCMGTPQDIKAIIDTGKGGILTRKWHLGSVAHGMPPLDIVMVRNVAVGRGCSQFDGEHCALHHTGLKPSEGKFATHGESNMSFWGVAASWFLDENAELVAWLRDQFPAPEPLDDAFTAMLANFASVVAAQLAKIENPADLSEREEICMIAMRQLQKGMRLREEAMAIAELVNQRRDRENRWHRWHDGYFCFGADRKSLRVCGCPVESRSQSGFAREGSNPGNLQNQATWPGFLHKLGHFVYRSSVDTRM